MIRLGMTDCPAVRGLMSRGALKLDYLEVHGPYAEKAREAYPEHPMLLHNALYQWSLAHSRGLAHRAADCLTLERLALTRSPWYSLHLGFSAEEVDFFDEAMHALSPILPPELIFERTCAVLNDLTARLDLPVLIENLDYNPGGAYETVCQPDFIRRVLAEAPVFLLLDLAHARISAEAQGLAVREYLERLPLEKVRQVHVNRPQRHAQRLWDAHEAMQEEDYGLLAWVLDRAQPWAVTLEYNKDETLILEQTGRLRQVLQG
ncbi:MAG TPA: DUF692 family protein [Anaerolineaceae bacterium]|nr:DUF692 family protein [Anaerolineaceae bacterium]HPN51381.1 DUF692 family protein [Anaerolineaceae bacterium]